MVDARFDPDTGTGRIVLRPNRSWSWHANLVFLGILSAVCLTVATAFLVQGLWLVVPFSLIELAAVGAALYYCARRSHRQEVLTFSADELLIERGHRRPESRHLFKRFFTRFLVHRPRHPWYPTRVAVRGQGRELEIGAFLAADDKDRLITELQRMVTRLQHAS